MNKNNSSTLFEQLPAELIRSIFEYLSPLDLVNAFEDLNSRLLSIIHDHPLCLPNNRRMSLNDYEEYIEYILTGYSSQIVYLYLSEHRTPDAVRSFLFQMYVQKYQFPKLKAITIHDIPLNSYKELLFTYLPLFNFQSLTIDIRTGQYYSSDYGQWTDIDFIVPILNSFPQLCSLYLKISSNYNTEYINHINMISSQFLPHLNLHTLFISQCSRELFVELLSKNCLPNLVNLRIAFPHQNSNKNVSIMQSDQIPLNKMCVPKLRRIKITLLSNVEWLLNYLKEIYRCEQLEEFIIEGYLNFNKNVDLPRANILRQWLMICKSKQCNVRFHFNIVSHKQADQQDFNDFLSNYEKIFGRNSVHRNHYILIHYPNSIKTIPISNNENVNDLIDELEIDESDYIKDKWIESVQTISQWFNLRKITILGDCTTDENAICRNLSILLHVAQRAAHFCELEVQATLAFGVVLSSNVELCRYLADHLKVLRFCGEGRTCSFLQLVEIVNKIYSHSSPSLSLPIKKLTIFVDTDPSSWLTIDHFQKGLQLVLDRFSSLIHFTLYCSQSDQSHGTIYDLNEVTSDWYSKVKYDKSWNWRSKKNSFNLWL